MFKLSDAPTAHLHPAASQRVGGVQAHLKSRSIVDLKTYIELHLSP